MAKRIDDLFNWQEFDDETSANYRSAVSRTFQSLPTAHTPDVIRKQPTNSRLIPIKQRVLGEVVSAKMDKTIVVRCDRTSRHPLYGKVISKAKKFYAHDEHNLAQEGDIVEIVETRPLSKTKRWTLQTILRRPTLKTRIPPWLRVPPLVRLSIPEVDDGASLARDRKYKVCVQLELEQMKLFEHLQDLSNDTGDKNDKRTEPTYRLIAKLGGPYFKTTPPTVSVEATPEGTIVDPPCVSVIPTSKPAFASTPSLSVMESISSCGPRFEIDFVNPFNKLM